MDKLKGLLTSSNLAAFRNVLSGLAGAAVAFGLISTSGAQDLVNRIVDAVSAVGGAAMAIGTAIVAINSAFAGWKASPAQQQSSVAQRPDKMVVTIDPSKPVESALAVAQLSQVKAVVTNEEVADATPLVKKIVGPSHPDR